MDIFLLVLRLLLTALLYAFLAVVVLMLWRDLRKSTAERTVARPRRRLVVVQAPPDEPEAPSIGDVFSLQSVTSIGRSPGNTVVLQDTYASSQHALLTWREGHWWVADQGSRNGTLLNGTPVEKPTVVSQDDVIQIGRTKLRLEVEAP